MELETTGIWKMNKTIMQTVQLEYEQWSILKLLAVALFEKFAGSIQGPGDKTVSFSLALLLEFAQNIVIHPTNSA